MLQTIFTLTFRPTETFSLIALPPPSPKKIWYQRMTIRGPSTQSLLRAKSPIVTTEAALTLDLSIPPSVSRGQNCLPPELRALFHTYTLLGHHQISTIRIAIHSNHVICQLSHRKR